MRERRKTSVAFSLIEILIILAVICFLAAILFPALKSAYTQAQTTKCLVNIHSYGTALLAYIGDNGGLKYCDLLGASTTKTGVPQFNKWLTDGGYLPVTPHLRCPLGDVSSMEGEQDRYRFPYSGNSSLCLFGRLSGIPAPASRVVLAGEVNDWDGFTSITNLNDTIWNGGDVGTDGKKFPVPRYHGTSEKRGLHFFFLDGSARLIFPTDNDWGKAPVCAAADTSFKGVAATGYFYHKAQFQNMLYGKLRGQ